MPTKNITKGQLLNASSQELKRLLDIEENEDCRGCRYCTYCPYCRGCTYCTDCTGCTDCTDCTGCTGQHQGEFMVANIQLTKEEYWKVVDKL